MHTSPDEQPGLTPHLVATAITAGYGSLPIIRDVSLTVARGQIVTVIGPNGSGKSTLMKAIMGVLRPMAGTVTLADRSLENLRADQVARLGVGYVPQVRDVFEPLTVRENLEMGGYWCSRGELSQRIDEVVAAYPALGGMLKRAAGNLSGGERKMVAIGRVLMTRPSCVILDEPTAGLAPKVAHTLLSEHVTGLARRDVAVLLVEQRAREALSISDFAYVMVGGGVRIATAAEDVLSHPELGAVYLGRSVSAEGPAPFNVEDAADTVSTPGPSAPTQSNRPSWARTPGTE
jgi:ABC-type branched-subunit amino acid transport system ATPase component